MTFENRQRLRDYSWQTVTHDEPRRMKRFKLMEQVMRRKKADAPTDRTTASWPGRRLGRKLDRRGAAGFE